MNKNFFDQIKPIESNDLIRLGRNHDGGYVINKSAITNTPLISFGVSVDWSFETDYYEKTNAYITMYDGSVNLKKFKLDFLNYLINSISISFIIKMFLKKEFLRNYFFNLKNKYRIYNGFKKFVNESKVSFYSLFVSSYKDESTITLNEVFQKSTESENFFLKIDIEGHEYRLVNEILINHNKINGLVIEFHNLDIMLDLFYKQLDDLKEYFYITHVHANNFAPYCKEISSPNCWELTFINKKINIKNDPKNVKQGLYNKSNLDFSNNPGKEDFLIYFN